MASEARAIRERRPTGRPLETRNVYHLAKRGGDADWVPVWCGGGIVFPGNRETVPAADVCPDCKAARKAARA